LNGHLVATVRDDPRLFVEWLGEQVLAIPVTWAALGGMWRGEGSSMV